MTVLATLGLSLLTLAALAAIQYAWVAFLGSPVRHLYSPPRGSATLALTWLGALGTSALGLTRVHSPPWVAVALVAVPVPWAIFATLLHRDQRRAAAGLPPVTSVFPQRSGRIYQPLFRFLGSALCFFALLRLYWPAPDTPGPVLFLSSGLLLFFIGGTKHFPPSERTGFADPPVDADR